MTGFARVAESLAGQGDRLSWIAVAGLAAVAWVITVMKARDMGNGPG